MRSSLMLRSLVLSLMLVTVLAPSADTAVVLERTPEQDARLATGEVVVSPALPPGADVGALGGTVAALVHASPDAVWDVLVDYPSHSGLFPRVVGAQVLESAGRRTLVRYVIAVGPFSFGFHVNNYPDPGHRQLDWRLADDRRNDLFRASSGYWRLEPHRDGVVVTYAMAARTFLPAFLTRGAERDGLVETIKAVRARAEQRPRHS